MMTITAELYEEINSKLIEVLSSYKNRLTQYDMLIIGVNLLLSYMDVVSRFDGLPKEQILEEVVELLKTRNLGHFISNN